MSDKKMCPLMIGKEERKAYKYGQGDIVVPILYPCIGEKCMAYDGNGNCDYWMRTIRTESEEEDGNK